MDEVRAKLDAARPLKRRIGPRLVDAVAGADIRRPAAEDDAAAAQDAAAHTRRLRRRRGLTQAASAARIGLPLDRLRRWEGGERPGRAAAAAPSAPG